MALTNITATLGWLGGIMVGPSDLRSSGFGSINCRVTIELPISTQPSIPLG